MSAPAASLAAAAARARAGQHVEPPDDASWPPLAHAAIALSHSTGAPLADVLDVVVEAERARERRAAAREAALAGPRASARLLRLLPVVGVAISVVLEPRVLGVLATTPLGWCAVGVGAGLAWAGARWLTRMERRAARAGREIESGPAAATLLAAATRSGLDVRTAMSRVGVALVDTPMGADCGASLERSADRLRAGEPWAPAWRDAPPALAGPIAEALRVAWEEGVSPVAPLTAAGLALADDLERTALVAARELDARSALPVALCLLPAFVAVGIVPLVIALAASAVSPLT